MRSHTRRSRSKSGRLRLRRALRPTEQLEHRRLLTVSPVEFDHDIHDHVGHELPVAEHCGFLTSVALSPGATPGISPVATLGDTFKLHSRPGATKIIYLDFDGHVTSGTAWNDGGTITTPAFTLDSNATSFSDAELLAIQEIWTRVTEDFSPFDVDVTTQQPGLDDLRKVGASDTKWGIRVVIGENTGGLGGGGIAYLGSFNWDSDTPCFVFPELLGLNSKAIAEATSHEVGHTLGLKHDGGNGDGEYYAGQGSGATGWAPIMGVGYYRELVQWSKGEYSRPTNTEDDLAIIVGAVAGRYTPDGNGFGYRADDHGGTKETATMASTADFAISGVIEQSTDIDVFGFTTSGQLRAAVTPAKVSPNLDLVVSLLNSAGTVISTSNPTEALDASFSLTVSPGTYYLAVRGTGKGDPKTTGYSSYGSLGQYTVSVGTPVGPTPTVSAADVRVTEGNTGTTTATVTVSLSAAATSTVTVSYATVDGTARTSDKDYSSGTGTVTFAAGETQKTISLQVIGDTKQESDETFLVRLSNVTGAVIGRADATVTIANDDSSQPPPTVPSLSVADVTVDEGNSGTTNAVFTVTLSVASQQTVSVQYATRDGTATVSDSDYVASSGRLSFAPGETSKTVSVVVRGDTRIEADETFSFVLSNASGATVSRAQAQGKITNDDSSRPPDGVGLSVADATIVEGNSGTTYAEFTISLSAAATQTVTVRYATADRSATTFDRDYSAALGSVAFAPGETTKTVRVTVVGDTRREADETFAFILSAPTGAVIARGTAVGTITNDDTSSDLTVSVADAQVAEGNLGNKLLSFTVTLSAAATEPVSVKFRTASGTATAGVDFAAAVGEIRFARGGIRQAVNIWIRGDRDLEENETFTLELFDAVGATLGTSTATGTIVNDDLVGIRPAIQAAAWADLGDSQSSRTPGTKRVVRI